MINADTAPLYLAPAQRLFAEFEEANEELAVRTVALLAAILGSPGLHARFLNTLSLMEHIGSRKIMATQAGTAIDQPTLKHLAEETRHAFFFKRQAEALARRSMSYAADQLLVPSAARMYFQRLEAGMIAAFSPAPLLSSTIYLYMSMIVEFRAVWAYRLYQRVLQDGGSSLSLRSLLAEESRHLEEMAGRLIATGVWQAQAISAFWAIEDRLYGKLLTALESCAAEPLAA